MTRRLDVIREIRDSVMEGCKKSSRGSKKKEMRKKVVDEERQKLSDWMKAVDRYLEDSTGMTSGELFPGYDWKQYYIDGLDPEVAAKVVLQAAESEDDDSGDEMSEGGDEEMDTLEKMLMAFELGEDCPGDDDDGDDDDDDEPDYRKPAAIESRTDDDVSRAARAVAESMAVDEASVMGGDFGRWGPATKAAGVAGKVIAASISKATGKGYTFNGSGKPSSAEGGSELWFKIETKGSDDDMYFLGFKIRESGDDVTWHVMLKKGKGLGSATTVKVIKGVQPGELSSAASRLKAGE